jgi:hypothetical protein
MFDTPQAKIAGGFLALQTLIVLIILIVIAIFFTNVLKQLGDESVRAIVWGMVIPYVLLIVFNVLTVFDVNCTVTGSCGMWAWIKTAFIIIGAIWSVVILVVVLVNVGKLSKTVGKKSDDVKEEFKDYMS